MPGIPVRMSYQTRPNYRTNTLLQVQVLAGELFELRILVGRKKLLHPGFGKGEPSNANIDEKGVI
jgi:hypothetical protein